MGQQASAPSTKSSVRAAAEAADDVSFGDRFGDRDAWQQAPGWHVTNLAAATTIRTDGFREGSGESNGSIWGPGVYVAADTESACLYESEGTETISVTVHLYRPLFYEVPDGTDIRDMESIAHEAGSQHDGPLPPKVQSHHDRITSASWAGPGPHDGTASFDRWHELIRERLPSRDEARTMTGRELDERREQARERALRDLLTEYGYDGIVISDPSMSRDGAGGNQVLLFNAQALTTHTNT